MLDEQQRLRYTDAFTAELTSLLQQNQNFIESHGVRKSWVGERLAYYRIQPINLKTQPGRLSDTVLEEASYDKRWISANAHSVAIGKDFQDDIRSSTGDPSPAIVREAMFGVNRKKNEVFINALIGDAYVGNDGTETVSLPTSQKIGANFVREGTPKAVGLTIDQLKRARRKLVESHAIGGMDGMMKRTGDVSMADAVLLLTQAQLEDLTDNVEVNSIDYNVLRSLSTGEPASFMGFHFLRIQDFGKLGNTFLPLSTANNVMTRTCVAYAPSAFCYGYKTEPFTKISTRDDKNLATQIYTHIDFGAVRDQEGMVVTIDCLESSS